MNTLEFFRELFEGKPHDNLICIFRLPSQSADFFKSPENAAAFCEQQAKRKQNIYFGTNFLNKAPASGRGDSSISGGVTCFYMDIDIAASCAHIKSDYPSCETEAMELVKGAGWDPSIIVNSGYGLHVYWLFKEPYIFNSDEDRQHYHKLLLRLQATIKIKAAKKGWRLDSTGDLARILRVPGTMNIKVPTSPMEVKVVETKYDTNRDVQRYNPEDIEPFLVEESEIKKTSLSKEFKAQVYADLVLMGDAEPPREKLEQLCEIEEKFAASWKAKRHEFGDDPSRYAQSLANYAARANWTKQEICNLLIAFYRRQLENPLFKNRPGKEPISLERIMRVSKLGTTIGKAIQSATQEAEKEYEEEVVPANEAGLGEMVDPDGSRTLRYVSGKLKLDIVGITRYIPEEGVDRFYEMEIKSGSEIFKIAFENVNQMFNQANFKLRIIDGVNINPKNQDKETWGKICDSFTKIIKDVKVSPSTETIDKKMKTWIEQYLQNRPALEPLQAYRGNHPFVKDGYWHVFAKPFSDWCWTVKGMVDGVSRTNVNLKRIGAAEKRFNEKIPENPKERVYFRAWRLPHSIAIAPPVVVVDNTTLARMEEDDADIDDTAAVS